MRLLREKSKGGERKTEKYVVLGMPRRDKDKRKDERSGVKDPLMS